MRNDVIDSNISHLGDLIETVSYYTQTPEHFGELDLALRHLSEYKHELRSETGAYLEWCHLNQIPIYINYYRVYRELK